MRFKRTKKARSILKVTWEFCSDFYLVQKWCELSAFFQYCYFMGKKKTQYPALHSLSYMYN